MNYLKIIILVVFCFFSLNSNAVETNNEITNKISKNIRCLVCQGQSVYDSQSDFATSLKILITKKLNEGYSEDQIYEYLRNHYGEWIVYDPKFGKNTFFLWLLPIFVFVIGGIIIFKKTKFFKL
tara:strand:+ start:432 stop:803 length:372 start_codon:yes stop_codon:yes gene_type:complete